MKKRHLARRASPAKINISVNLTVGGASDIRSTLDFLQRLLDLSADFPAALDVRNRSPDACVVEGFISKKCQRASGGRESARSLFVAYSEWARGAKAPSLSPKALGRALALLEVAKLATRNKSGKAIGRYRIVFSNASVKGVVRPRPKWEKWRNNFSLLDAAQDPRT